MFPVVLKQMAHGPLIASVGSCVTLTIQVEGILIESGIVHNTKGHIHLKGHKDEVRFERVAPENSQLNTVDTVHTYQRLADFRNGVVKVTAPLLTAIYVQVTPQTAQKTYL